MPTNEELQKRVDVLQRQLRKAGDHLKRLASENGNLNEQIERLSSRDVEPQALAQEPDTNHKTKNLSKDKDKATATVDAKNNSNIEELKAECARSRERIRELESQTAEMEAKAVKANDAQQSDLHEWETEAKELATKLGVSAKETGPALIRAIGTHINSTAGPGTGAKDIEPLEEEIAKLRMEATQELDTRQSLEKSVAELESKLCAFADGETEVGRVLDNLARMDKIPDTVPASLRPGLERAMQDLKANRNANGKSYKEEVEGLQQQLAETNTELQDVSKAHNDLVKDYDLLLERIGTMRDALKAKMNAESDELKRLRTEAASANQSQTRLVQDIKERDESINKLRKELEEARRKLWESQEKTSQAQYEHDDAIQEYERQIAELKSRTSTAEKQLESDSAQHTQLEERIELLQGDLNRALNAESQWVEERGMHLVTIQNLQSALESLQVSKDTDVDIAVEKLREELRQSAAGQRAATARAEKAEDRLRKIELSGATAEQCQQKITDQMSEIERLRHEVAVLKDHLNESMHRLREESSEFNLDKRVITNLVVGFLALPYGDSKRYEILQLMSSILQFSEEQQEKVGLIRKAGRRAPLKSASPGTPTSETTPTPGETKDSFSDQWISFLLRESSNTRTKHAPP
ncbi:hypothetical protein H4R20_000489 [Coemansia guatemalensis]|uniref:GRIP domain-containing protein n=1 Tax=Coemansia guatemalensis TaxID=2761395 RepID=A0A9W8I1C8_9FUNG|nr:hypothetical protein H4R20_000489 [Coemansia guatemalensis]